ncbi:MAG TPA: hypothetical protein VMR00_04795, partial [Streptosporangiaceae bacterium]|nr:hypothetical protein [Streptosporangiaceae bacterium]
MNVVTDPGWDIPGVVREGSSGDSSQFGVADAESAASAASADPGSGSAGDQRKRRRKARPSASLSAAAGRSAGAFARDPADSVPAATDPAASDPAPPPGLAGCRSESSGAGSAASSSPSSGAPGDAAQALASLSAALEFLAGADAGEWPAGLQADCLRALAVAESRATAVHARVLAAFCVPGGGLAGDGHRSPRVWLSWQTQSTARSAAVKVGWKNRLAGHPVLAAALAAGTISVSWAQ